MNIDDSILPEQKKPLAGACHHQWQNQEAPYVVAQVCEVCKLYRYKCSPTADWEYRAPIPFGQVPAD
jgi:hypothetical protein